jgi:hypothetical protein
MYEDQFKKFEKFTEQTMQIYEYWIGFFIKSLKHFSK